MKTSKVIRPENLSYPKIIGYIAIMCPKTYEPKLNVNFT